MNTNIAIKIYIILNFCIYCETHGLLVHILTGKRLCDSGSNGEPDTIYVIYILCFIFI